MRFRSKVLAGSVAVLVLGATAGAVASAADPASVPSAQRPIDVGSGYDLSRTSGQIPFVSASGRLIAFDAYVPDPRPRSDAFLRDRWTDTTFTIHGEGQNTVTAMSADGNYVAGISTQEIPRQYAWIYRHSDGQAGLVQLPPDVSAQVIGINNDGYFVVKTIKPTGGTPYVYMSGRVNPDRSVTPLTPSAATGQDIVNLTPSLRYAITPQGRLDMTTGVTVPYPLSISLPDAPGAAGNPWIDERSFAISRSGRYIAAAWLIRQSDVTDIQVLRSDVKVWDTVTGTVSDIATVDLTGVHPAFHPSGYAAVAALDNGQVVYSQWDEHNEFAEYGDLYVARPGQAPTVVSTTFAGAPVKVQRGSIFATNSRVATDIGRVVLCTSSPMSDFTSQWGRHCYLKQLPA